MIEIHDAQRIESNQWHAEVWDQLYQNEEFASVSMSHDDWYLLLAAAWEAMQIQQPQIYRHGEVWPILQKVAADVFSLDSPAQIQLRQDPDPRGCLTWDLVEAEREEAGLGFELADGRACSPYRPQPYVFEPGHIAHACAFQAAYPCSSRTYYSLAQRAVLTAALLPTSHKLLALVWSYPHALLGQVPAGLANHPCMEFFNQVKFGMFTEMATTLGLADLNVEEVKFAMKKVIAAEKRDLFNFGASMQKKDFSLFPPPLDHPILPLLPQEAEGDWLAAYRALDVRLPE